MKRIVITGASGLLGHHTAKFFLNNGQRVIGLNSSGNFDIEHPNFTGMKVDMADFQAMYEILQPTDVVIHTAAKVSFSPKKRKQLFETNVEGTANLVNAAIENKIKKLIMVSSVAACGRPHRKTEGVFMIDEGQKWEDSPHNTAYAQSKFLAECEVNRGIAEGLSAVILRPSVILGEGDWDRSSSALYKYVAQKSTFYSDGIVNYIDVLDLVKIVGQICESDISNEVLIASAGSTTYKNLFDEMAKGLHVRAPYKKVKKWQAELVWRFEAVRSFLTGKEPMITKETAQTSENQYIYDHSKLRKILSFEFTTLPQTIQRTTEYYLAKD